MESFKGMQAPLSGRRLLVYANEWAMRELPKDGERWWSRKEILNEVVRAGFEGMQAPPDWADAVRGAGHEGVERQHRQHGPERPRQIDAVKPDRTVENGPPRRGVGLRSAASR